ncbi:hypothetical protein HMPREF9554_00657 [Treponema phagedenis F0421]|nr:hypothetical protein HMPREF9554_00657 [Treponema phagedenis F0421]
MKLCKKSCFKTSLLVEPRASVPVLNVVLAFLFTVAASLKASIL